MTQPRSDGPVCKCGHGDREHISPAIDLGLPMSGGTCGFGVCPCRQFEPVAQTVSSPELDELDAAVEREWAEFWAWVHKRRSRESERRITAAIEARAESSRRPLVEALKKIAAQSDDAHLVCDVPASPPEGVTCSVCGYPEKAEDIAKRALLPASEEGGGA